MTSQQERSQANTDNSIDWTRIKRILVVKLRSIGDTVLSTPSLIALRRFIPNAQIDILLEDWVAPLLVGHEAIDNVISVGKGTSERLRVALNLRRQKYDVAFNLHGGTTSTFFTAASRAKHRVGYAYYQYSFLYNHLLSSASDFWQTDFTHSAEQQLALLGYVRVPVKNRPKTKLTASDSAIESLAKKFYAKSQSEGGTVRVSGWPDDQPFALLHPSTLFVTKQWATENFARTAEYLNQRGLKAVAISSKSEKKTLGLLKLESDAPVLTFDDLTLPEITALASKATIFIGNDSGIAHIAAAVNTPSVVVFGSSNRNHWRPWTDAPNEIVFEELACQPCPGYECKVFGEPRCILNVRPEAVISAVELLLS